ncbi:hypothetical protein TSOC_004221 [Tetrabaena socialis]|uniref:N-acetyltransferase domain-containing protein n=1 Tax=Tetrabaena socialis TaxID=47790 RepID=A0A2J8A9F5_9CHLO|nr:hypothetical protein TSOC_004221 [Tetrabaena socialis]|eukprot:PNH09156.1 hypothetical protein TSOC_004221 [Tetrabaena socialis]
MLRVTTPEDSEAILSLSVAAGLFGADETGALRKVLADHWAGNINEGHEWRVYEEGGQLRGVVYWAPAQMSDGAWHVLMLAVRPDCQGQGLGSALMQHAEAALRASGQRLLLVEMSGLPSYERQRKFYAKIGYGREAVIRDFYASGEDKVVFRKAL